MRGQTKLLPPALAALFCLFGVAIWLGAQRNSALHILPDPNGYEDLISAGEMLPPVDPAAPMAELRLFLKVNAAAIRVDRDGLAKECRVPVQFSKQWLEDEHLPNLGKFKKLARALAAEGTVAEADQRWDDAAAGYLDAVRLGNQISRGGLFIDQLAGIACEASGLSRLEKIVAELGPEQCRELVRALEKMDREKESFLTISKRERAWAGRAFGFEGRLFRIASRLRTLFRTPGVTAAVQTEMKISGVVQQSRILAVQLAARAYELEQGTAPETARQLIPDYISAVPLDPFTGEKLRLDSPRVE